MLEADIGTTAFRAHTSPFDSTAHHTAPCELAEHISGAHISCHAGGRTEHVTFRTEVCRTHFSTGGICDYGYVHTHSRRNTRSQAASVLLAV